MRRPLVVALAVVVMLAGGCEAGGDPAIDMAAGQRFAPEEITASAGQEIVFTNTSGEAHSVTAYSNGVPEGAEYFSSGGFDSEAEARENLTETLVGAGETYRLMLTEPGTYRYFCIPHEDAGMVGRIVIE